MHCTARPFNNPSGIRASIQSPIPRGLKPWVAVVCVFLTSYGKKFCCKQIQIQALILKQWSLLGCRILSVLCGRRACSPAHRQRLSGIRDSDIFKGPSGIVLVRPISKSTKKEEEKKRRQESFAGDTLLRVISQPATGRTLSQLAAGKAMEISIAAEDGSPPLKESFSVTGRVEISVSSRRHVACTCCPDLILQRPLP